MARTAKKSTVRTTATGKTLRWANLDDYIAALVERGDLADADDFPRQYPLHARIVIDWLAAAQTGCRFASAMAHSAEQFGWRPATFTPEAVAGGQIGAFTDAVLTQCFDGAEMALLIFPSVTDSAGLVQLLASLTDSDSWTLESIDDPTGQADLVGLRWELPTTSHTAWTVGFAPLPEMPFTRRAPLTTIAVRTSIMKRTTFEKTADGCIPVHLADIDHGLTAEQHHAMAAASVAARQDYLCGEYEPGARARVTFRLPLGSAGQLGLSP